MEATRVRFAPTIEWLMAAAFLVATIGVALLLLGALQPATGVARPAAVQDTPSVPAAVPAGAIAVGSVVTGGATLRLGDRLSRVDDLVRGGIVERTVADRGALGARLTRTYVVGGLRFVLVLEPFEREGEPRVAAIYLP